MSPETRSFNLRTWFWGGAVLAVVVALTFASSATAPFLTFDDPLYVLGNTPIQTPGLAGIMALWNPRDAELGHFIEYFPARDSIYWVLWQRFGAWPTAFHVANLLFHFTSSILVVALGVRLRLSPGACWSAGLIFAAHPGHLEAVAWIAALKDPMYTAFLLAAVLCYARSIDDGRRLASPATLAFLVLSLLSKSMGFIAPVLFILIEIFAENSMLDIKKIIGRLVLPTLISALFLLHFLWIAKANGVIVPPHGGSWGNHVVFALWGFTRYLQQALVPFDFEFNRCFAFPNGARDPRFAVSIVVVVVYAVALLHLGRRARRRPLPFFLLAWFTAALFPVLNLIPFPALVADRYLYAPSVALALALGWAGDRLRPRLRLPVLVAVVGTLASVTALRGALWHQEWLLWQNTVDDEACPDNGLGHLNVGAALGGHDQRAALQSFHRAFNRPGFGTLDPATQCQAHAAAAQLSLALGDPALARRHVERAISLCPQSAAIWEAATTVYAGTDDAVRELEAAEHAVAFSALPRPQNFGRSDGRPILGFVWNRGLARWQAGKVDAAAADFLSCLQADPAQFCVLYEAWRHSEEAGIDAGAKERVVGIVGPACANEGR